MFHEGIKRNILRNINIILEILIILLQILETIPEIILPGIILYESFDKKFAKFSPQVWMF